MSGYFALHAILIENVFELLIFLTLSVGTTLWVAVFPHGLLQALVLAAAFALDLLAIVLIFFLPSSICSSFGYYHFRLSAVARVQSMYHTYQSLLTLLKVDCFITLLLLVRSLEHFGRGGALLYVVGLSSLVWQALCWRSVRREDGGALQVLLSMWWPQPMMAVYLLVAIPKVDCSHVRYQPFIRSGPTSLSSCCVCVWCWCGCCVCWAVSRCPIISTRVCWSCTTEWT